MARPPLSRIRMCTRVASGAHHVSRSAPCGISSSFSAQLAARAGRIVLGLLHGAGSLHMCVCVWASSAEFLSAKPRLSPSHSSTISLCAFAARHQAGTASNDIARLPLYSACVCYAPIFVEFRKCTSSHTPKSTAAHLHTHLYAFRVNQTQRESQLTRAYTASPRQRSASFLTNPSPLHSPARASCRCRFPVAAFYSSDRKSVV